MGIIAYFIAKVKSFLRFFFATCILLNNTSTFVAEKKYFKTCCPCAKVCTTEHVLIFDRVYYIYVYIMSWYNKVVMDYQSALYHIALMRYLGYTWQQISDYTGRSESTCRSYYYRKCRSILQDIQREAIRQTVAQAIHHRLHGTAADKSTHTHTHVIAYPYVFPPDSNAVLSGGCPFTKGND